MTEKAHGTSENVSIKPGGFFARRIEALAAQGDTRTAVEVAKDFCPEVAGTLAHQRWCEGYIAGLSAGRKGGS